MVGIPGPIHSSPSQEQQQQSSVHVERRFQWVVMEEDGVELSNYVSN